MFLFLYTIGYFVVFRSWDSKIRPEASSCFISFFHGTPVVFLAALSLLSSDCQNPNFASPNTPLQNLTLEFSISYFLADLVHFLIFNPTDFLFIGHHLATLFVIITCRFLVLHGASAILVLLILAEVTSFCQNTWTLASARRKDVVRAEELYDFLSPPFYAFYSVVRGFLAPLFVYQMGVFYISGKADIVIPKWVWLSWMVVVCSAISVSILWISNLWIELYRERTSHKDKKVR
ncbi:hypothetical protein RJ641_022619 [Dillenia turbinata]|uniref:TLC domain-containing protein n=1 Tax=Dillenia turbinata TaxID=194707 RepID=A0AAN8ULY4_9MAGN